MVLPGSLTFRGPLLGAGELSDWEASGQRIFQISIDSAAGFNLDIGRVSEECFKSVC